MVKGSWLQARKALQAWLQAAGRSVACDGLPTRHSGSFVVLTANVVHHLIHRIAAVVRREDLKNTANAHTVSYDSYHVYESQVGPLKSF